MFQYVNVIKVFHNTHTIKGVKYFALLTPFCLITPSLEASKDYDSLKVNEKLHFRYILIFCVLLQHPGRFRFKAGTPKVLQTNLKAISETESVYGSQISEPCKLLFAKILQVQATNLKSCWSKFDLDAL